LAKFLIDPTDFSRCQADNVTALALQHFDEEQEHRSSCAKFDFILVNKH